MSESDATQRTQQSIDETRRTKPPDDASLSMIDDSDRQSVSMSVTVDVAELSPQQREAVATAARQFEDGFMAMYDAVCGVDAEDE